MQTRMTSIQGSVPTHTRASSAVDWSIQASKALLRRMLDSADDVLFELSGRASSDEQRRGYFDSMRLLRKSGAAIGQSFAEALETAASTQSSTQSSVAPMELKGLSLRDDDEVQEEITVANIVQRVDGSASQALWELGLRVEQIPGATGLRERLQAVRPKALAEAFLKALRPLELSRDLRLILFKLFERQLLADARALYVELNRQLEAEGYTEDAVLGRARLQGASAAHKLQEPPQAVFAPPSYALPPTLLQSLGQWQQASGGGVPGMPASMTDHGGAENLQSSALFTGAPQRLSLVHQLLEETGRHWPEQEIDALRKLLEPIVRIALSDSSFFANAQHPARRLIAGLDEVAAGPQAERSPRLAAVEAELLHLQQQAATPTQVDPLDGPALLQFLASQRSPRDVTSARLSTARKLAHQQVKALGSGHDLPVGLAPFLTEIWLPLMSALSMRFGTETSEWQRATELLKRLFGESRWISGEAEPALVSAVLEDVSGEMAGIGVPEKLVQRASQLLEAGLGQGKDPTQLLDLETLAARPALKPGSATSAATRAQESADAMADQLIDWRAGLPVGAWFRVFERATDRTLWMMADVFYPEAPSLSFTGFDPEVRVSVRKREFLTDLREGRAEAVDPTPEQTQALTRLCLSLETAKA